MTTLEPGASDVFTQGLVLSPASTAFLASSPAPSITDGFDVFVQLVMAAMATSPWSRSWVWPSASVTGTDMCDLSGPSGAGGRPAVSSASPAALDRTAVVSGECGLVRGDLCCAWFLTIKHPT